MDNLLNDIGNLGFNLKVDAVIHIWKDGEVFEFIKKIDFVPVDDQKKLKELRLIFLEEVQGFENANQALYKFLRFTFSSSRANLSIISSSMDELWEMFKADRMGKEIPTRKCYSENYIYGMNHDPLLNASYKSE